MDPDMRQLLEKVIKTSIQAGEKIMEVYSTDFSVEHKSDNSPLTQADMLSNQKIEEDLEGTEIPILSEEGKDITYSERANWEYFWCVDPLDGTKEFVKKNGEFTVNVALIHNQKSILGVIYAPAKNWLFFGAEGVGAYKLEDVDHLKYHSCSIDNFIEEGYKLPVQREKQDYVVVGSRSHMSSETLDFINQELKDHPNYETISMGSSLKICLVAEGKADLYPRFAPTMEWDTAAGHAIAKAAGKQIIDHSTNEEMKYNKENLLNNWFIVR